MDAVAELWRRMPVDLLEEDDVIGLLNTGALQLEEEKEAGAISVINAAGLQLIKEFEGLRLDAYICPAGVWTVGYGSTGEHVYPGQVITEPEAEELLRKDLWRFRGLR